jgi:hypothetical protein
MFIGVAQGSDIQAASDFLWPKRSDLDRANKPEKVPGGSRDESI